MLHRLLLVWYAKCGAAYLIQGHAADSLKLTNLVSEDLGVWTGGSLDIFWSFFFLTITAGTLPFHSEAKA
jgi:hypothetical protein